MFRRRSTVRELCIIILSVQKISLHTRRKEKPQGNKIREIHHKKPKAEITPSDWSSNEYSVSNAATRVAYLDDEVLKGAFYFESIWRWQPSPEGLNVKPHAHDFDEVLAFFGTNPEYPFDLCGEVELWLGDEEHAITESCTVFIPRGLKHCPLIFHRVDRPIFYLTTGPSTMYTGENK